MELSSKEVELLSELDSPLEWVIAGCNGKTVLVGIAIEWVIAGCNGKAVLVGIAIGRRCGRHFYFVLGHLLDRCVRNKEIFRKK